MGDSWKEDGFADWSFGAGRDRHIGLTLEGSRLQYLVDTIAEPVVCNDINTRLPPGQLTAS
ncbi:hypothetical protein ACS8MQ_09610 [Pseudomonas sp. MAHUQ-62]|uniref:hypothetical protein n=1 Tax=Pseudomonas sp. GCM10023245 TaxID=3252652 RepID=UPI00360E89DA